MSHGARVRGLLLLQAAAFWPVWAWYASRLDDGSDEPAGALGLLLAVAAWARLPERGPGEPAPSLRLPVLATLAYAVAYPLVPPLLRAALALVALALLAVPARRGASLAAFSGLLLLSLPVTPTLQFYLGHPLRVISAAVASLLLGLSGMPVGIDGTCLRVGAELVAVDAPCSGVRMLWGGQLLAFLLAAQLGLGAARTAALAGVALGVVLVANGARAAALFLPEVARVGLPDALHAGTGVVCFGLAAAAILRAALVLGRQA